MRRPLVALVILVLAAAACGPPQYRYVRNPGLRTAFRVPSAWTTFDKATLLGQPPGPDPTTPDPIEWLVGFDGNPDPSVSNVLNPDRLNTDFPQGIALVQAFSWDDRDTSSYGALRNYLFPVDQLLQDANSSNVLAYSDDLSRDGVRGVHIVFQFRYQALSELSTEAPAEGQTNIAEALERGGLGGSGATLLNPGFVTVNQVALVDEGTDRAYVFAALCSSTCYERNRGDIESAVDSWTVIP